MSLADTRTSTPRTSKRYSTRGSAILCPRRFILTRRWSSAAGSPAAPEAARRRADHVGAGMPHRHRGSTDYDPPFAGSIAGHEREAAISTEVELKLAVRATDLPEMKRALMAMAPVSTQKRLISTYYDTPDAALKERGLTLRVRDQGGNFIQTVKAGVEPISEIELELKDGDATVLYDLAAQLLEVAPLRIEARSKSERGYQLVEHGVAVPQAVHADPVILDRDMTVDVALQNIGRSCLAQLLRNEPAVLSARPEGVHQMRVAVRRLRSAISSLKKLLPQEDVQWVTEELRWLGGALGPARNLDVFAAELVPPARTGLPDEPGWDDLAVALDRRRVAAYDQINQTILSQRYTASMLRLLRWFEGSGWRRR